MVTPVTGPGTADPTALSSALGTASGLGETDFLQLLVAQLKNQDPLAPQDNTQFVAQLAQFSSLQQTMGVNTRLDQIMTQNQGLANTQNINLVGKTATVKGSLITDDGSGVGVPFGFTLGGTTATTTATIQDASGNVIRQIELGPRSPGLSQVMWDGRNDAGNLMPAGTYAVSIQAKTADGSAVSATQETTGVVSSVSFDKGYPVLTLDNGMQVPVSDLIQVESPPNPTNP
ncbi:MAG TPA: flagellar hook capping FlgD N-terminal domain-containing protein [Polyangiaceae bacterium]|jgi:flagellar basal-body rod modification protein FlgD